MAGEFSFDIVSDFDRQELVNAVDQTHREMIQRYDLKDTKSTLELEPNQLVLMAPSDMTLKAVLDVLESKMVRRNLDLKVLDIQKPENAGGSMIRQTIKLRRGITQDTAKQIVKLVRDNAPKAKAQIQGDAVRVTSKSKDDLQHVMTVVKQASYDLPLQFQNYR